MAKPASQVLPENRLLAALPETERDRLVRRMDEVTLDRGDVVFRPNKPISHVYFPRTGIMSIVVDMEDGGTVEVGTIGREGMVGLPLVHGADRSPNRVYCQVPPCVCQRLQADLFQAEMSRDGLFRKLMNLFAQVTYTLASQSTACNRLHLVEQRLARWLLMTQDREGRDEVNLTQQIIAEMLGVRRASITTAAGALQQAGLIKYRRGRIKIEDRAGLKAAACECYGVVKRELERLLG